MHATTFALCAACHKCLPGGKAMHLGLAHQKRAHTFVQRCLAEAVSLPGVVLRNYNPNGDCFCFGGDYFHSFFSDGERKTHVSRRCATCNQQNKHGEWYKVGDRGRDCVTVDDTRESKECRGARTLVGLRRVLHAKAQDRGARGGVMEPPRLPPLECVQERIKDVVASWRIVEWREAGEWLRHALPWGKRFSRRLLSSVDTELWLIIVLG